MKILIFISTTLFLASCFSRQAVPDDNSVDYKCTSAREYITAVNYLRDDMKQKTADAKIKDLALEVAKGCTGAAERFALVRGILLDAKFDAKTSNNTALKFAKNTEEATDAFLGIFKVCYEKKGLDLTSRDALSVAERLSIDYRGEQGIAEKEFRSLTRYCLDTKELNLPRQQCASIAKDLLAGSEAYKEKFADQFIELVSFLRDSEDGPGLTTKDAVAIASQLINISPHTGENFIATFKYAMKKDGLNVARNEATTIAKDVASFTKYETKSLEVVAKP